MYDNFQKGQTDPNEEYVAAVIAADLRRRRHEAFADIVNSSIRLHPKKGQEIIDKTCYAIVYAGLIYLFIRLVFIH